MRFIDATLAAAPVHPPAFCAPAAMTDGQSPRTPSSEPNANRARATRLVAAANALRAVLERGQALDANALRDAMTAVFSGSDADGFWLWKDAYEAAELAAVLFLRGFGNAIAARSKSSSGMLAVVSKIASLLPSQTRRSEESERYQQFSTPLDLAFIAAHAAAITQGDVVLEPSAGTGLLAIHAELKGATLALNELAGARQSALCEMFPDVAVSGFDGEHIDDCLAPGIRPSAVLMNPPFSAANNIEKRSRDTALRHIRSAFTRLAEGGRLVAITGANQNAAEVIRYAGVCRLDAILPGKIYARHGTTTETRITVCDKGAFQGSENAETIHVQSLGELLDRVERLPSRLAVNPSHNAVRTSSPVIASRIVKPAAPVHAETEGEPINYTLRDAACSAEAGGALYQNYRLDTIEIADAKPHPTPLVQSAAMASVMAPKPTYRPHLPSSVIETGLLSDAQIETVIYAGDSHASYLDGYYKTDDSFDTLSRAADGEGVRYRRGFFLGDGTGCGKGRQAAGILLDNWLKGRRRALWISKSDKLLEDAQRDWSALGQEKLLIAPLSRFKPGSPVTLSEGILFTTYATLRASDRDGASRLDQILRWLGDNFDGVVLFDEAHAMANAAASTSERGDKAASQQGRAGLRLQHSLPDARIVYLSATGATAVQNLSYAQRLGLWGGSEFPFATRDDFVAAIEAGGIAAMEVVARDLKALGLYMARSLSYNGVTVDMLEHALTDEQIRIYDAYAGAFQIIHSNMTEALKAANVTCDAGTLNARAKSAARSAFESNKQRFFNHLITAMKTPALIAAASADVARGDAVIVQLVSTGESLLNRRLAEIPPSEWDDLTIDITPREYVLDYLKNGFPVQLYERFEDDDGQILSRPLVVDGQPVQCQEAVRRRDALLERLSALPPVQSALDQIIHHFGTDQVAEVTGRSRRIVKRLASGGATLAVETRGGSANLTEAQAFMDDDKRVLVFSDAGGTGRSYHADRGAKNQRQRIHYLVEAGWRADNAIQGLGRSNRTNQVAPPVFRPVASDVRGEKRFLSTIAKRLDTLGAITRGQRQTGGQGLFRAEDNLESQYARDALRQLYQLLYRGKVDACSLLAFEEATGLSLTGEDGSLRDELPPISTFLNRILALPIGLQNALFAIFEGLLDARIESAVQANLFDVGLETLTAESLHVADERVLATHKTGASTTLVAVDRREKNTPLSLDAVLELFTAGGKLYLNGKSGRAALALRAPSLTLDDGGVVERVRLIRPLSRETLSLDALDESNWEETSKVAFTEAWQRECASVEPFTTDRIHLVTGLLLPVWKSLPQKSSRIYRLTTDDGRALIGRLIAPDLLAEIERAFGLSGSAPIAECDARAAVLENGMTLSLRGGLSLKRSRVMGMNRIELVGFDDRSLPLLKSFGVATEIIAFTLRAFVPVGDTGDAVLTRLFEQHPILAAPQASQAAA